MIKRLKNYKIPLLLTLGLFVFHLCQKDFKSDYEHPIAGDAQAYYAYLPALFIYNDLNYNFVEEINEKYYPVEQRKSFLKPAGNGVVNKTFPGVAILYLPFFLIAHALALLFGLDPDGYSFIYQVCFDIGLWFYLALGLIYTQKILRYFTFSSAASNWAIIIIALATNVFFYSVYDQSVTHIYNLFLVNFFLFAILKFKGDGRIKYLSLAIIALSIMAITRPTNALVLGLVLFFIPDWQEVKRLFLMLFKRKFLLIILAISLPIISIPLILWKLQTGNWLVYSYGDEGFDFLHPHFREFLFSYVKGWFTYTPIAFFILLIGFIALFKENKKQFVIGLTLYAILIFVFSSWWCWYYGAGMSQRVMIDYSIFIAFLIALIYDRFNPSVKTFSFFRMISLILVIAAIALNTIQSYQIRHGILPGGSATQTQYWDTFLSLEKKSRVYPHDHWVLESQESISLQNNNDSSKINGQTYFVDNAWIISVTDYDLYSASVFPTLDSIRKGSKIIISFEARARTLINQTRAVLIYENESFVYFLDSYLKENQWVKVEFMFEPTRFIKGSTTLYFWNGGTSEKVEFKNIKISHYFSDEYL